MRSTVILLAVAVGLVFVAGVPSRAQMGPDVPWLSATPPFTRAGGNVTFTVTGPPGHNAAIAYSFANLGGPQVDGQTLLLGPDWAVLGSGQIAPSGSWTSAVQIPAGAQGEVFLQAAVWPSSGGSMTLTNGIGLFIVQAGNGPLGVPELVLSKRFSICGGSPSVFGIEFRAHVGAFKPIREAWLAFPPSSGRPPQPLLPFIPEGLRIMTPSGYPYIMGFEYEDNLGTTNLGLFPDGTYTFNATFADGSTASTSVDLGGTFPDPPTVSSPACGATGVSRGPTIQFSTAGAAYAEAYVWAQVGSDHNPNVWEYTGTATTATVPSGLLWPNFPHGVGVEAYTPSSTPARKSSGASVNFTTGP